jgi:hypothetical protein
MRVDLHKSVLLHALRMGGVGKYPYMKNNRKMQKIGDNNLYPAPIIWLTKSRNRRRAGHVVRTRRKRVVQRGLVEKRKRMVYLGRHGRKCKFPIDLGLKKRNCKM